jgi:phosphatidylglycerophosphate synthase
MLDIQLRPMKDRLFDTITLFVPPFIAPLHVTLLAFLCGIQACYCTANSQTSKSILFWALNRALDCLDGALARYRQQASDLGGFLDLLGDFIVYSAIPIACALPFQEIGPSLWIPIATLEASFHINNFVLFYVAAVVEKRSTPEHKRNELTSLAMQPALIEGTESALFFTAMLVCPEYVAQISWSMLFLVGIGIIQRVVWLAKALS